MANLTGPARDWVDSEPAGLAQELADSELMRAEVDLVRPDSAPLAGLARRVLVPVDSAPDPVDQALVPADVVLAQAGSELAALVLALGLSALAKRVDLVPAWAASGRPAVFLVRVALARMAHSAVVQLVWVLEVLVRAALPLGQAEWAPATRELVDLVHWQVLVALAGTQGRVVRLFSLLTSLSEGSRFF